MEEISPFARGCLLTNKLQFLRLFCDAGLKMYEFADMGTIEELFTAETQRNVCYTAFNDKSILIIMYLNKYIFKL